MADVSSLADGPLTGLRAVEFGQLIAGPFVGTLLADFGAAVIKVEAPPKGDALREWGRHKHNGRSLWWSVMALGRAEPPHRRLPAARARAVRDRRRGRRELPPRHDGALEARPRGRPRGEPRLRVRAGVRLRADRPLPRPARLRVGGEAIGVVPKLSGTPGRVRRPARWTAGANTADVLGDLREEVEELDLIPSEGVM